MFTFVFTVTWRCYELCLVRICSSELIWGKTNIRLHKSFSLCVFVFVCKWELGRPGVDSIESVRSEHSSAVLSVSRWEPDRLENTRTLAAERSQERADWNNLSCSTLVSWVKHTHACRHVSSWNISRTCVTRSSLHTTRGRNEIKCFTKKRCEIGVWIFFASCSDLVTLLPYWV